MTRWVLHDNVWGCFRGAAAGWGTSYPKILCAYTAGPATTKTQPAMASPASIHAFPPLHRRLLAFNDVYGTPMDVLDGIPAAPGRILPPLALRPAEGLQAQLGDSPASSATAVRSTTPHMGAAESGPAPRDPGVRMQARHSGGSVSPPRLPQPAAGLDIDLLPIPTLTPADVLRARLSTKLAGDLPQPVVLHSAEMDWFPSSPTASLRSVDSQSVTSESMTVRTRSPLCPQRPLPRVPLAYHKRPDTPAPGRRARVLTLL